MKNNKIVIRMCVTAVMAALSVALAFLAKSIFGPGPLRVTFENVPVFVVSFSFGPIYGLICAVLADLLSCAFSGMSPIPLITVGAAAVGAVSGIVYKLKFKKEAIRISVSVSSAHLIGSVILKTIILYTYCGATVFLRIPIYILISVIESFIIITLFKRKSIRKMLAQAGGNLNEY